MTTKKELNYSSNLAEPLFKTLCRQYNVFLLTLIGYTLLMSKGPISFTLLSGDVAIQLQSFAVLITLGIIPFSLWYFGKQVPKMKATALWEAKEKMYRKNCAIRLLLLWSVIFINISCYFLTLSYSFLLCAAMGLVASIFCVPSLKKIEGELFEDEDEESSADAEQE